MTQASLLATPESIASFKLYERCRADSVGREALRRAAEDRRSDTLPGFAKVLQDLLGPSIPLPAEKVNSERLRHSDDASIVDEKERVRRGGRGGMADSLMSTGALALVGIEQDLSDVRLLSSIRCGLADSFSDHLE